MPFERWRIVVLTVLMAAPMLCLMGLGGWWLWQNPHVGFFVWWPMMLCFTAAYLLAWWWQRKARLLPPPETAPPLFWTQRDHEAWRIVEARAKAVKDADPEQLLSFQHYVDVAQALAHELARFYHPKTKDPIGALTIPEILAVVELAAHDLSEMVDQYLPAGHLLTIDHWRSAPKVREWYNWGSMAYWAASALFNPIQTVTRYAAAHLGVSQPLRLLQDNLVAWFYVAYVNRVGAYLIEVNSGRLKVGARRYRELVARASVDGVPPEAPHRQEAAPADGPVSPAAPATVTITVLGQVKAGKSSVINALLGERRAATDLLPLTAEVTQYELKAPGVGDRLVLLDTVGYLHEGPREDQLAATERAVHDADVVLIVLNGRDPARQPDLELLRKLQAWFAARPHLRQPPLLGVLTHVDLLSPVLEWSPPYDWQAPRRPKEQNVAAAVATAKEALAGFVVDVVPVCSAEGKVFGVREALLPRIVQLLGEGRAVSLLRCLHAEADAHKIRKVLSQLLRAGETLLRAAAAKNPVA